MSTVPLLTIIFGPTASGKTARALTRAREHQANILSFDSRQLYTGMTIGTGKDIPAGYIPKTESFLLPINSPSNLAQSTLVVYKTDNELEPKIYGYDLAEPDETFSIATYAERVAPVLTWHRNHQKPLVLVGGSWPYVQVLIDPPASLGVEPNLELRQELKHLSLPELQSRAQQENPERFTILNDSDRANPRRLIRVIEIAQSELQTVPPLIQPDEYQLILHEAEFETIEENIRNRITQRLQNGMIAETQALAQKYDLSLPAFSATGYTLVLDRINGVITQDELEQRWFLQERQYAKRQLTWVRKIFR